MLAEHLSVLAAERNPKWFGGNYTHISAITQLAVSAAKREEGKSFISRRVAERKRKSSKWKKIDTISMSFLFVRFYGRTLMLCKKWVSHQWRRKFCCVKRNLHLELQLFTLNSKLNFCVAANCIVIPNYRGWVDFPAIYSFSNVLNHHLLLLASSLTVLTISDKRFTHHWLAAAFFNKKTHKRGALWK